MTEKTFSLEEAADLICGPERSNRRKWLMNQLRKGRVSGYKVGQSWRMTRGDVEAAIESLRPRVVVPEVPVRGLTRTSARRLSA